MSVFILREAEIVSGAFISNLAFSGYMTMFGVTHRARRWPGPDAPRAKRE